MDSQSISRLLSYVVCETTIPVKKHVYNFAVSDQITMKPQLLSAAALTAISQTQSTDKNTDMAHQHLKSENVTIEDEIQALCEGTEIEKSALEVISSCDLIEKESQDVNALSVLKRKYSGKEEEQLLDSDSKILKVETSTDRGSNCLDGTDKENVSFDDDSTLPSSDSDFKVMFKVSRSTFQILVEILSKEELESIEGVTLQKKVLIVLWLLGNSVSHEEAAQKFQVSEEAVTSCFFDICATLYNKSDHYIKWPSSGECDEIASRIETHFGFPGVVGVLGCQYFTISIPKESISRREHFNGKLRMYCVALQIVCDDECVIRDVAPGLPGGIRPAQVLRDSTLGELLATQPAEIIDPNKHILARSDFPQLTSMLTPYNKKSELLKKEEEEFNVLHESVCLLVDQTYKMLKDRFRILKFLDPETATMVLVTACVLHNICLQNGDVYDVDDIV